MMNFNSLFRCIVITSFIVSISHFEVNAQSGQLIKSVATETSSSIRKWFGKKAAKETTEEIAEQGGKAISASVKKTIAEMTNDAIYRSSAKLSQKTLQDYANANIKKTIIKTISKEINETALKATSKEFAQQLGKTTSSEAYEYFAKRLGNESSKEVFEQTTKNAIEKKAFDTKKNWGEILKDKLHKLRLQLLQKIRKSKIYKELLEIYSKGPISLTDKELSELLAHPEYFNSFLRKTGSKSKSIQTKIEFFIRLKKSNPQHVKEILANPVIKEKMAKALRGQGYMHEWLMVKNFEDFLLNPKWGDHGDLLAMILPRLVQKTDNIIFKVGGKHGATNSTRFHIGLAQVIDKSTSIEELFVNIRRYAKQNLDAASYNEFLQILESLFKA